MRDRRASSGVRSAFNQTAGRYGRMIPRPLKRLVRWMRQPRVMLPLAGLMLAVVSVVVYYTLQFSQEIDARLQSGFFDRSVGIFTAPFKVSLDSRLSLDQLTSYLEDAGYQRTARHQVKAETRSYTINGNTIEIHPDATTARELGVTPVRAEISKDGRVVALSSPQTGERLKSAYIEGEPLACLRDGDRRKQIAVQFADIPAQVRDAVVAIEDRRFFTHSGIDYHGIARALWADL